MTVQDTPNLDRFKEAMAGMGLPGPSIDHDSITPEQRVAMIQPTWQLAQLWVELRGIEASFPIPVFDDDFFMDISSSIEGAVDEGLRIVHSTDLISLGISVDSDDAEAIAEWRKTLDNFDSHAEDIAMSAEWMQRTVSLHEAADTAGIMLEPFGADAELETARHLKSV